MGGILVVSISNENTPQKELDWRLQGRAGQVLDSHVVQNVLVLFVVGNSNELCYSRRSRDVTYSKSQNYPTDGSHAKRMTSSSGFELTNDSP